MTELRVAVAPLDEADLAGYALKIAAPLQSAPDSGGPGWECWFPLGRLPDLPAQQIGCVRCQPLRTVTVMEMHPRRSEVVFAIDRPVIQVLALPSADKNAPEAATARALFLKPGEALQVLPGVWHGVGLAYEAAPTLYWFILAQASAADQREEVGWSAFANGETLKLAV